MTQSKGHPHAALMLEYAKDAAEYAEPWLLWELSIKSSAPEEWLSLIDHPNWSPHCDYRRALIAVSGGEV